MDEKTLNLLLKFGLDSQSLGRVKSGVSSLEKELDNAKAKALATQKSLLDMSESAKQAGQTYAKIFAVGVGVTGGIFAAADRYVKNAQVATETTKQWTAQTEKLQLAQGRIGAVLAEQALPLLQKAADLAGKAANFVDRNPEIVKAALNIGVAVASIGAIGMAVTKGIKLYADVKFALIGVQQLAAGKLMADAAKMQLAASAAGKYGVAGGLIGPAAAGSAGAGAGGGLAGAASGALLPIVTTVVSLLAGSYLGTKLGNLGGKAIYGDQWQDKGFGDSMKEVLKTTKQIVLLASPLHILSGEAEKLGLISHDTRVKIFDLQKAILGLGDASEKGFKGGKSSNVGAHAEAMTSEVTSEQMQIVDSYVDMLREEKQAAQQYASDRLEIIRDAQARELSILASNQKAIYQINTNYNKQVASITANFQKASAAAERSYAQQRAQVIRNAGVEIRRIEEDHQANMRKLLLEHNDRVNDLVSSRDALGLVREMRDYERRRQEEEENTNKQIARRRQDVAQTLRDMAEQHAAERAERLADYKQQLKDAAEQKTEALKQQAEKYREEMAAAQKAKADALRALSEQYNAERQRRREAFAAQVRDLDASMQGEQKRRQAYYTAMLRDVEIWAQAYRRSLPSGGHAGSGINGIRDMGGYATKGIYGLAQDGRTEFVLSGDTTRAAEALIGARLTQENMLAAMRQGGGRSVVWNDQRRFDSRLSQADRRAIQSDTMQTLAGVFQ